MELTLTKGAMLECEGKPISRQGCFNSQLLTRKWEKHSPPFTFSKAEIEEKQQNKKICH